MQVNRELERQFVADTKTQFGVPFDEYYNKYIKWLEEKAIQTQAGVGVLSEPLSCEQVRLNTIEECAQHLESLAIKSNDLLVEERHILQEDTVELFRNDIEYLRQLANSLRKLASKS